MPDGFNSTDEQRRRGRGSGGVTGHGFQPGRSGNPGGRPRADVTALARAHTAEAIRALVKALDNPRERVAAAAVLLDRGWGKAAQPVRSENETTVLHLIAAQDASRELLAELATKPSSAAAEPAAIDATALPTE